MYFRFRDLILYVIALIHAEAFIVYCIDSRNSQQYRFNRWNHNSTLFITKTKCLPSGLA